MARYVSVYPQKNVVVRKCMYGNFTHYISSHSHVVCIENDDGRLVELPVMFCGFLSDYTADEYLKECEDEHVEILYDSEERIRLDITEWVCNEGVVRACSLMEAVCSVVSILTEFGMWKNEYADCIDTERIKKDWEGE